MPTEIEVLQAQVEQLQTVLIEALQAQIDDLRRIIGQTTEKPDPNNPPAPLENGRYPLTYADYEVRVAIDVIHGHLAELEAPVTGPMPDLSAEEIASLKRQLGISNVPAPAPVVVTQPAPVPVDIAAVVAALEARNIKLRGDVEMHGRLFLGDGIDKGRALYPSKYPLQFMVQGRASAAIASVSNLGGTDAQNPTHPHFNVDMLSDHDGGSRRVQNMGMLTINGVETWVAHIDPTREHSTYGTDSRGTWTYDMREPGKVYTEDDSTQALWIRPERADPANKTIDISAPQVGFSFRFRGSSRRDPVLKVILDRVKSLLWD